MSPTIDPIIGALWGKRMTADAVRLGSVISRELRKRGFVVTDQESLAAALHESYGGDRMCDHTDTEETCVEDADSIMYFLRLGAKR
jgi:hypothetical protein